MAILAQNGLDPNDQANQGTSGGSGTITNSGPTPVGGGSAPGVGGAPSTSNQTVNRGNPSGTPNVNNYLQANQNAGQNLASGITNNVQNQANQVNSQVNSNSNSLNSQYNPINNTLQGGQSAANTAFQNPQALLDAYNAAQAQNTQGAGYQGAAPNNTDLQNYNAFQGDVAGTAQYQQNQQGIQNYNTAGQQANNQNQTNLTNLGQVTGSGANELGRNQLLQNTVGNPNYNQGQQTLDSLFLQNQGNQLQQNLSGIQNTTAQNVNNANTDYQSKLSALQNLSGQNSSYAQNLFLNGAGANANAPQGTGLNQISANVANEYANAQTQAANAQALGTALVNNTITPDQLAALGIAPNTQTWGLSGQDISNAGNFQTPALLAANQGGNAQAANANEFARYNALNQLAGGPSGAVQPSIFGSATTAGNWSPQTFDTTGMQNAISQQQQNVTNDFQTNLNKTIQALGAIGSSGGQTIAPWQLSAELQKQENSGNLTPQQAEQEIQQYMPTLEQFGTAFGNPVTAANYFNNYYTNEFEPDATATIGGQAMAPSSPVSTTPSPVHVGTPMNPATQQFWNQLLNNSEPKI
jgi:hypothetical protein